MVNTSCHMTTLITYPIYIKTVFPLNYGFLPSSFHELYISQNSVACMNPVAFRNTNSLYPQSSFHCRRPSCFTSPIASTYIYISPTSISQTQENFNWYTSFKWTAILACSTSCTSYFTSKEKVPNMHRIGICVSTKASLQALNRNIPPNPA